MATYWETKLAITEQIIDAYEAAILAIGSEGVQSYKLDTGQNVQWVTYADLPKMNAMLDSLYNRRAMLNARITGDNVHNAVPAW